MVFAFCMGLDIHRLESVRSNFSTAIQKIPKYQVGELSPGRMQYPLRSTPKGSHGIRSSSCSPDTQCFPIPIPEPPKSIQSCGIKKVKRPAKPDPFSRRDQLRSCHAWTPTCSAASIAAGSSSGFVSAQEPHSPRFALILTGKPIAVSPCSTLIASLVAKTRTSKNILAASAFLVRPSGTSSCRRTDFFAGEDG